MDKILNRMYDIFAFALPGMSILAAILLLKIDEVFLYKSLPPLFRNHETIFLIMFAFAGYLTGYILSPVSKKILICFLEHKPEKIWKIYTKILVKKDDSFEMKSLENLKEKLTSNTLSKTFVTIREKKFNTAQYIEFWDMHMYFSLNMCIAIAIGIIVWVVNMLNSCNYIAAIGGIIIGIFGIIMLFYNAVHFALWWNNDIDAAANP